MNGKPEALTKDQQSRIAEIRERVREAQDNVKKGARLEGNKLVLSLEFEDEGQLTEKWLQAIADCNSLLCILDGGNPI